MKKPFMIEFFSGSKTVSNTFSKYGFDTFTIDINPFYQPDLCIDILDFKKSFIPYQPSFLWFSPVCTHFSRAAQSRHWLKNEISKRSAVYTAQTPEAANSIQLLNQTVDIINSYPDTPFIIENPVGRILHFDSLKRTGHYRYYVNYFEWGFPYSKETFLFSNILLPLPTVRYKVNAPTVSNQSGSHNRSKVPTRLIEFLIPLIPF